MIAFIGVVIHNPLDQRHVYVCMWTLWTYVKCKQLKCNECFIAVKTIWASLQTLNLYARLNVRFFLLKKKKFVKID